MQINSSRTEIEVFTVVTMGFNFLGRDAVCPGRYMPVFRSNLLPPSYKLNPEESRLQTEKLSSNKADYESVIDCQDV